MNDESDKKKVIKRKLKPWTGTVTVLSQNTDGQQITDIKIIDLKATDADDYCGKIHDRLNNPELFPNDEIYIDGKYENHIVTKCHIASMGV